MVQFHGEDSEIIGSLLSLNHLFKRYVQLETIDLMLNLDFPGADDAEVELVGGIFTRRHGGWRELFLAAIQPQEGMRIQQQPHGVSLSQKLSERGSSKLGRVQI
jgi:hypothetical protein